MGTFTSYPLPFTLTLVFVHKRSCSANATVHHHLLHLIDGSGLETEANEAQEKTELAQKEMEKLRQDTKGNRSNEYISPNDKQQRMIGSCMETL